MKSTDLLPILIARTYAYDFLRRAFLKEPDEAYLQLFINKEDVISGFPFVEEHQFISTGIEEIQNYFHKENPFTKVTYENLHWDYTRLFIGPNTLPAPPWESAYLNEERLLFQKETLQVRRAYLAYHFLPKYVGLEADDHIGLELDFMYQLSKFATEKYQQRELDKLQKSMNDQQQFLENHLLKWIPMFCRDVVDHADTDFYIGMAHILNGFIKIDVLALQQLTEVVKFFGGEQKCLI